MHRKAAVEQAKTVVLQFLLQQHRLPLQHPAPLHQHLHQQLRQLTNHLNNSSNNNNRFEILECLYSLMSLKIWKDYNKIFALI